jgi:hypothetical protein
VKVLLSATVIAAMLVAMTSAGVAYGATETVSLGSREETGPEPAPLLEPPEVQSPLSFKVTYTATPIQPILVTQYIYCTRGSEHPGVTENLKTVTPPFSATLTAPSGSDSCQLAAMAETPVGGVPGTVKIEAEATRTTQTQSTPTTPKRKKCRKGRRLRHGKCVKRHHHNILLLDSATASTTTFPSSTTFMVEGHGISGAVHAGNPKCRRHRTILLSLRALTSEEAGLDFRDRAVPTGNSAHWHLSVPIPKKGFTLEVGLNAKTLGHSGPYVNSCGSFFKEKGYNVPR